MDLVDDDHLEWKPSTGSNWMTMGQLLRHITEACGMSIRGFVTGDWGMPEGVDLSTLPPEEMLPPAEMDFSAFREVQDRLCTFDSKFKPGSRHYDQIRLSLPAALTDEEYDHLERVAQAAYRVMGCRDYARLDIRLRDGIFHILDVNPNPDISSDTSMACAAEVAGYSYGAMLSQMVNLAAHRHPGLRP